MTRPLLLLTRPAEEAGRTAAAARDSGFDALVAPLLDIRPLPFRVPEGPFDALLFTSARAPRLVAEAAPGLRRVPAHAVGARTAEEAVAAGFRLAGVGAGNGSDILAAMARSGVRSLLHLAGEASAPLQVPVGVRLVRVPVYAAERSAALPPEVLAALAGGQVFSTLLFSARTARHFGRLVDAAAVDRGGLRIVSLSAAVAEAAGEGWAASAVAESLDLAGALAAARRLWQGVGDGR